LLSPRISGGRPKKGQGRVHRPKGNKKRKISKGKGSDTVGRHAKVEPQGNLARQHVRYQPKKKKKKTQPKQKNTTQRNTKKKKKHKKEPPEWAGDQLLTGGAEKESRQKECCARGGGISNPGPRRGINVLSGGECHMRLTASPHGAGGTQTNTKDGRRGNSGKRTWSRKDKRQGGEGHKDGEAEEQRVGRSRF